MEENRVNLLEPENELAESNLPLEEPEILNFTFINLKYNDCNSLCSCHCISHCSCDCDRVSTP